MLYIIGRFPNALSNFAWGVLFSAFYIHQRKQPTNATPLARLGYVGLVILLATLLWQTWVSQNGLSMYWYTHAIKQLLADIATFLLLFFIFDGHAQGTRLFSAPGLKYLGVISYEWFLLHQPIILLSRRLSGGAGGNLFQYFLIVFTPILLTLIAAILIYHHFSAPIIEWGRRRIASQTGR
jgi:peptidoglycan/LPS O-acetylase OafA/YrhL